MANATLHRTHSHDKASRLETEPSPDDVHAVEYVHGDRQLAAPLCTGNPDHMALPFPRVKTISRNPDDLDRITCPKCRTKTHMVDRRARRQLRRR